uniref:Uncharacterized protein n=1 Tax=Anguilla anguilla TaxID=7936 RepID=A0A0E9PIK5_ANGAN
MRRTAVSMQIKGGRHCKNPSKTIAKTLQKPWACLSQQFGSSLTREKQLVNSISFLALKRSHI